MAVLEPALAALQTLILVQNHDNNVILAASGGSGGRCEQRCEYSIQLTIRGGSIRRTHPLETTDAPVASYRRVSGQVKIKALFIPA